MQGNICTSGLGLPSHDYIPRKPFVSMARPQNVEMRGHLDHQSSSTPVLILMTHQDFRSIAVLSPTLIITMAPERSGSQLGT